MTEQSEKYQKTLKAARERDPEVDLVLDTTAEDVDWLRAARGDGHAKTSDPKRDCCRGWGWSDTITLNHNPPRMGDSPAWEPISGTGCWGSHPSSHASITS